MDFAVRDLGATAPYRITDSGLVLAYTEDGNVVVAPDGTNVPVPGGIGGAYDLNDGGRVLCRDEVDFGETVWLFDSAMRTVESFALPGHTYVWPAGINAAGDVVGSVALRPDKRQRLGWIRAAAGTVSWTMPTIESVPPGGAAFLHFDAINDGGQAVGTQGWAVSGIDSLEVPIWFDGVVHTIGSPAGAAEGDLITNGGRMRVSFTDFGQSARRAVFDATTDTLTGQPWYVVDMNDAGAMLTLENGDFCYRVGGKAYPIESAMQGWSNVYAKAMNAAGLIAGFGEYTGERRGFVLTPEWNPVEEARIPDLLGRILSGIVSGAGGLMIIGGRLRWVPPRSPVDEVIGALPDDLAGEMVRIVEEVPRDRPVDEVAFASRVHAVVHAYRQAQLRR